ncbi:cupin domain-containing protein [Microbacterium sp. NPDC058345]|uniref:cupin domain-containing protein n=1 Tax=Microbacterium sp. NPDC058345 TaxID=3346455 RepID=UPI0036493FCA
MTTFLKPQIFRPGDLASNDRGGGARTTPLTTRERGATAFLNGITSFDPGARIAHHTHNVTESVMVIEGDAIVDIDGVRTALRTFDTTLVPANIPHHFENASTKKPMRIFWTYASVDASRTIVASGERGRIDAEHGDGRARGVREVARITVDEGANERFEAAVAHAAPLFQAAHGARSLVLEQSEEDPRQYQLVVSWDSSEDHTDRFRSSEAFAEWRRLISDSVSTTPDVRHFRTVLTAF